MNLTQDTLREMYWRMLLSRRFDERAWELLRQGEITFHMSGIGHEAAQVGMAFAIDRGRDWVVPYYRDLALMFALGLTPREFMLGLMAKSGDPVSGGRQMPGLWSLRRANVVSHSVPVATQTSHAVGIGLALKLRGEDRVVLTAIGEGGTSSGEWYEAVNWAAIHKLPVIFMVENNKYALSLPQDQQMAVQDVAEKANGLGLPGVTVDGIDLVAVYQATLKAVERARVGRGPTLIEAKTYRITPHSSDDDDRRYRSQDVVKVYRERDPLRMTQEMLVDGGVLDLQSIDRLETKVREIVEDAVRFARESPDPQAGAGAYPVYAAEANDD